MSSVLFVLVLVLISSVACDDVLPVCQGTSPPCDSGELVFPQMDADDTIIIYWLEAPLMEYLFGNLLGLLGFKHAAIGFQSTKTSTNYTVEYVGEYGFFNTSIPHVITFDDGTQDLLWCNPGYLCTSPGIDQWYFNHTQWSSANIFEVGKISGTEFNELMAVLYAWTDAPTYNLWMVMERRTDTIWLDSYTCQTFALWLLDTAYSIGASFSCDIEADTTDVSVFSYQPTIANYSDPATHAEIIQFYTYFSLSYNTTFKDLVNQLEEIAEDPIKFVYVDGVYYFLNPEFPYLGIHTRYYAMPGCEQSHKKAVTIPFW